MEETDGFAPFLHSLCAFASGRAIYAQFSQFLEQAMLDIFHRLETGDSWLVPLILAR
jgi:hypothetical protein